MPDNVQSNVQSYQPQIEHLLGAAMGAVMGIMNPTSMLGGLMGQGGGGAGGQAGAGGSGGVSSMFPPGIQQLLQHLMGGSQPQQQPGATSATNAHEGGHTAPPQQPVTLPMAAGAAGLPGMPPGGLDQQSPEAQG